MAIRDIDTLKANMPIGVAGGTSSSDMHDIVDTMADMTSQEALTKTASYTAVATDNRRRIVFNSASAVTLTLPNNLPVGWECSILQIGAGQTSTAGNTYNWKSGLLTTAFRFDFRFGYMEERSKQPSLRGFWPAFWTWQVPGAQAHQEIDAYEYYSDNHTRLYMTSYPGGGQQTIHLPQFDPSNDYHVYAVDIRSSGITYYVDGVQVGVHTNPPTENTNLMTNMAVFSDVPPLAGTNTEKKEIEYVRVYSYDAAATPIAHSPGFNGAYYWEGGGIGFFRNSPKHDWTVYNAVTRDGVSIGTLPGAVSTADLLRTWQSA